LIPSAWPTTTITNLGPPAVLAAPIRRSGCPTPACNRIPLIKLDHAIRVSQNALKTARIALVTACLFAAFFSASGPSAAAQACDTWRAAARLPNSCRSRALPPHLGVKIVLACIRPDHFEHNPQKLLSPPSNSKLYTVRAGA